MARERVRTVRIPGVGNRPTLRVIGARRPGRGDMYHYLVAGSWTRAIAALVMGFLLINSIFAVAYDVLGGVANVRSLADAFFFSVQTMGTIGYGVMYPTTVASHVLVTVEAIIGLLSTALATGLVFAKFSRPKARVMFSKVAVVAERDGVETLMFRVANERSNLVVEAQMRVAMLMTVTTREGETVRKLFDIVLERSQSPAFILTWTALHPIGPGSPLYGMSREQLEQARAEFIVSLSGIDEALSQTIHSRYSYLISDVVWGMRFADLMRVDEDGARVLDLGRFHDVIPNQGQPSEAA